jgi:hypothetical protein
MSATNIPFPQREICPPGFGEGSVGREMIRVAQEGQKKLSVLLGQWEMIITFFKHGVEIPLCINPQNESIREQHRLILTGAMSLGELLLTESKNVSESELASIGYSKQFLNANIRYLRDTYNQWYIDRDAAEVEHSYNIICNASENAAPAGVGA